MLKKLSYFLEYLVFITFVRLFQFLGIQKTRKLTKVISLFVYYIIPLRKKIIRKNLQIAFPELKSNEINDLIKKIYFHNFLTFAELFLFEKLSEEQIKSLIKFDNPEIPTKIINDNLGAILLTAHFGNWELGAIAIALNIQRKLSIVYKKIRNPYIDAWLLKVRNRFNNSIPLGISLKELILEIRNKSIIGLVADQRAPKDSKISVKFFNTQITAYEGPATLAIKYNTPIYLVIAYRDQDFSYNCFFQQLVVDENSTETQKIEFITQEYYTLLENIIKKYPEQWFWLHNRWKHINT